jgi:hypothetical protein
MLVWWYVGMIVSKQTFELLVIATTFGEATTSWQVMGTSEEQGWALAPNRRAIWDYNG